MRTPLEITTQLNELLKRSKPFRNSNEIFRLIEELLSTLSPSEELVCPEPEIVEETVVNTEQNVLIKNEEGIFEEITLTEETVAEVTEEDIKIFNESVASFLEIESIEEPITEQPVTAKKSTKKKSTKKK